MCNMWEEMLQFAPVSLMIEATFMSFRNAIISDGLVMPYNVLIGNNINIYMDAKKSGMLIKAL